MTIDPSEKLRELALFVTRGDLRRPWSVQTSNSFRRIGTDRGDGDVLCAVTQRTDGHPDLHAAPAVLDYIVAAHPFAILQLIRERDSARHALHLLRHKITGNDRVFREAGGMAGIYLARATMETDQIPTDRAAAVVRDIIADLTDRSGLRQAWEEIDDGIRREIVENWEKIARDQIAEVNEVSEVPEAQLLGDTGDPAGDARKADRSMTFRKLLETMQQFAVENPDHEALDRQVVVRVGVPNGDDDEDLHVGGLQSAVVDAGCTDEFALVLDADQELADEAQEGR